MGMGFFACTVNSLQTDTGLTEKMVLTPPEHMLVGDVAIVTAMFEQYPQDMCNISRVVESGGQVWQRRALDDLGFWWCQYNGSWIAEPAFEVSGIHSSVLLAMSVYRP